MTVRALRWLAPLLVAACAPLPGGERAVGRAAGGAAVDAVLAELVAEHRGSEDRFGLLFASFDGERYAVHVAGDIAPDDHLRLGSVSKVYLAYLFLREGPGLDESIAAFHPPADHPGADVITPRLLLSHTSGIPDEMVRRVRELGDGVDPAVALRALQPILAAPAAHPDERIAAVYGREPGLDFEPGTAWCYSNTGYLVLGRMLERATGSPIEALMATHFGPVAPSLRLDDGRAGRLPASYPAPWPIHHSQPWVAGAMIATARDALAAFHHIARQPEFETMRQWTAAPRCPIDVVFGDAYGLGLQRYRLEGLGEAVGHDGNIIARSFLFRLGDTAYLVHTTRPVTNQALRDMAGRLLAPQARAP